MAYGIKWSATVCWIGDGVGPMEVPSAQSLKVTEASPSGGGIVQVPGGNSPSSANIVTAMATAGVNAAAALNVNIAQIQGFATGGQ